MRGHVDEAILIESGSEESLARRRESLETIDRFTREQRRDRVRLALSTWQARKRKCIGIAADNEPGGHRRALARWHIGCNRQPRIVQAVHRIVHEQHLLLRRRAMR